MRLYTVDLNTKKKIYLEPDRISITRNSGTTESEFESEEDIKNYIEEEPCVVVYKSKEAWDWAVPKKKYETIPVSQLFFEEDTKKELYQEINDLMLPKEVNELESTIEKESATAYASLYKDKETKLLYTFGFEDIQIANKEPAPISGFMSKEIQLPTCDYITLSVNTTPYNKTKVSLEYYIVEGTVETPILPIEETQITNESVFFNLPSRFIIDQTKSIVIRKNGKPTNLKIKDIQKLTSNISGYSIDYTPLENPHAYYPKGNSIKIKVIQRCQNDAVPASITSILINRIGGKNHWIM